MAALSTIVLATVGAAVGGGVIHGSRTQARELKKEGRRVERAGAEASAAVAAQRLQEEQVRTRDAARERQRAAAAAGGRQSTILTAPLGEIGQAQTTQRTLLGL
jgi:hypothetical protein